MSAAPQQTVMPLPLGVRAPVVTYSDVRRILGVESWTVDAWVQQGSLGFVFDVASPEAKRRSALRFLRDDLALFQASQPVPERTPEQVVDMVWGAGLLVRSRRVMRGLAIEGDLLYRLAAAGVLPKAEGSQQRRGANGGAVWPRESLVAFLKARQLKGE